MDVLSNLTSLNCKFLSDFILLGMWLVCMTNSIEIATRYFPFFGDPTGLKNAFKFTNGHPWNDISLLKWSLSFR